METKGQSWCKVKVMMLMSGGLPAPGAKTIGQTQSSRVRIMLNQQVLKKEPEGLWFAPVSPWKTWSQPAIVRSAEAGHLQALVHAELLQCVLLFFSVLVLR